MLTVYVLKNGVGRYKTFFLFLHEIRTNEIRRFLIFLYPLKNSMLTRTIFIYSVTYKVNLFGKAFAHVRLYAFKQQSFSQLHVRKQEAPRSL
jgi:hypothetical protein